MRALASLLVVAAALGSSNALAQSPAGGEFQVNTYTTGTQRQASLAMRQDGAFLVVWDSEQDGSTSGIFGQRHDSLGAPQSIEFQINSYTQFGQQNPAVAFRDSGEFVVVWTSAYQDGSSSGVFGRRFDAAGTPLGVEFKVNELTLGLQGGAAVAVGADGDFVVAWQSLPTDPPATTIVARQFDETAQAMGPELQVASHTTALGYAAVAVNHVDGSFVVVWHSNGQDGSSFGIFSRRFDSGGVAVGAAIQVNVHTAGRQSSPTLAMADDGGFVVIWQENFAYLFGRRYDAAASAQGGEFQVHSSIGGYLDVPDIAMEGGGEFVVAWQSDPSVSTAYGVRARRFALDATPVGDEFTVSSFTPSHAYSPSVGIDGDGEFVVVWERFSGRDIFGQRFALGAALDADGDGTLTALTDGLLILRYLFGFTGATLISGVVGGDCTRCSAEAIDAHLDSLGATLDVDGDGDDDSDAPLTDGLLIVRYLFGFRGATLVAGAVAPGAPRDTPAEIEAYIETLL